MVEAQTKRDSSMQLCITLLVLQPLRCRKDISLNLSFLANKSHI